MTLLRLAGFSSVRVTSQWQGTEAAAERGRARVLRNVAGAAQLSAVGSTSPSIRGVERDAADARGARAVRRLRDEPQAAAAVDQGRDHRQRAEHQPLLAAAVQPERHRRRRTGVHRAARRSYDAVKAVDPATRVWGGALAPRGIDRPGTGRDTHSPSRSSRTWASPTARAAAPCRSWTGSPSIPTPTLGPVARHPHPNSTTIGLADYDRLMRTLATAFDNSPQAGSLLPVLYDEFGVESKIPAGKAKSYTGSEPATTKPVDEITQGAYYARALQLAFCQPNVTGIFVFHTQDEPALASWQSGVYYADGTPKSSIYAVRDALARARGGSIARCDGLGLDVDGDEGELPDAGRARAAVRATVRFTCTLDCIWELRVSSAANGATRLRLVGYGRAGAADRRLAEGPQARHRPGALLDHAHPRPSTRARRRRARAGRSASASRLATYHAGMSEQAGLRAHRGRPGRPVRLVPLLQDRPRLAPAADRGARGGQGRVRRGRRGLGRPDGGPAGLQRLGHPAGGRLLPLADHGALRRPARARRRPQRHAARRLADDAVLVPRDDEAVGLHRQEARPPGQGDPARRAVSRRLPVRQAAALVRPHASRSGRRRCASTRRSAASSSPSRTTRPTRSGSTTRSSCRRSSARSRPTSCT